MHIASSDIRRAAMDLLARREHGSQELCDKLLKRFRKIEANVCKGIKDLPDLEDCSSTFEANPLAVLPKSGPETDLESNPGPDPEGSSELSLSERIEIEVQRLAAEGLQSDERLAEAFIRSRANRGQGPVKIKAELRQKGIPDHVVLNALEEAEQDWYLLASEVANKKFKTFGADDQDGERIKLEPKEKAKRSRFLQQRGFTFDHISAIDD